jgi:mono/diheme cytochrome c family protein
MPPTPERMRWVRTLVAFACAFGVAGVVAFMLLDNAIAATAPPGSVLALNAPAATLSTSVPPADREHMLNQYCAGCHNDKALTAGMSVQGLHADNLGANDATWEKILHKLSLGEMPPKGMPAPSKDQISDFTQWLSTSLDQMAAAHPNPGRATLRRLNRAEYANAVRDLLDLDIDVSKELPVDDTGYGFDNIADVLTVSPTLMDRYVKVAGKISRTATGQVSRTPVVTEYKITKDMFANERADDNLPLDSRGGGSFKFYAPYDANYKIYIHLNPGPGGDIQKRPEDRVELKIPLKAGLRTISASFAKQLTLEESLLPRTTAPRGPKPTTPQPQLPMNVQVDGVPVKQVMVPSFATGVAEVAGEPEQAVFMRDVVQIDADGPYDTKGPGNTPSRRRIFICRPSAPVQEDSCAEKILTALAQHAYRRPVTAADIAPLMKMYRIGRKGADFDHGIEAALEAVLVSPDFLFMTERDAPGSAPGSVHRISDVELATRLSFFLWSSIPDDGLMAAAQRGQLHNPLVLKAQVTRMLADPRAKALTDNFAGQWLYLRRLEFQRPDQGAYPNFDQRLRSAMLTETNMFFDSIVQENRSVLDFLDADYTYVNQRLAEHYGIPGIYGTTFRRVSLDPALHRGGLLGQGSILTVTSYNNRTSVVLRGKWILDNLLAASPPPPPPNVPSLDEVKNAKSMTVREQMEMHRANPVCASCHTKMDPLGFSLENFDATGAWRNNYAGKLVDASAVLPDGTKFDGPQGLKGVLLSHKDQFVEAFTQRLMTYALGRGVEAYDMPAVRGVRIASAQDNYRIQSIILGIAQSVPFVMRRTPDK